MRGAELALVAAGLAASACVFLSDFDGLTGGQESVTSDAGPSDSAPSDSAPDDPSDGGACETLQFKLCTGVPAAPNGFQQTVDGLDDDFCHVPTSVFQPKLGVFHTCGADAQFIDAANASVAMRVAWSASGVHFFAAVRKAANIPIVVDTVQLYKGDALELFFANRATPNGNLVTDGAAHLIVAPPGPDGGPGYLSSPSPWTAEWATRLVQGGYDVELVIPWTELGGPAPESGSAVVLDVGVDITGPKGERYQSFLAYTTVDGGQQFCKDNTKPTPSESTLTWCSSKLE